MPSSPTPACRIPKHYGPRSPGALQQLPTCRPSATAQADHFRKARMPPWCFPGNTTGKHHQTGIRSIIGPHYFATLGIPIIAGREFDARDRPNTPDLVILNQTLARKLFGTENPVGRTVTVFNGLDPTWIASVAGIAADHYQSWRRANAALLYTPA